MGSVGGPYYSYGLEENPTPNGTEKFATYTRDAETGLDYAQNRYNQPGWGSFMTADPYQASGGSSDPGSWNRYAYARGDPVNRRDPEGKEDCEDDCSPPPACPDFFPGCWPQSPNRSLPEPNRPCTVTDAGCDPAPQVAVRTVTDIKNVFYSMYQGKLNDCIQSVFGNDASKIPTQTLADQAIIDPTKTSSEIARIIGYTGPGIVIGGNDPSKGAHGTVYIANDVFYSDKTGAALTIYGTYVHELGNTLDEKLNPDLPAGLYGRKYAKDGVGDGDTGSVLENCVFGSIK